MMKKQIFYILFPILLLSSPAFAQLDSINLLDEVVLSDVRLFKNSLGQQVQVLNDSVLKKNEASLTSVLKFNSLIYFKENGPGMVSSPSFRGTTASQTAVIWNGININSQLNGQTDFNTILASNYDQIAVRAGGGSVVYGSGAIGGSVHLNNNLKFNNGLDNEVRLEYGSFETILGAYSLKYSSEKTSLQFEIERLSSDNDFQYLGTDKTNQNGDFENLGLNFSAAHILDKKNTLNFYTSFLVGERGFSGTLTAPSKNKYEDVNSRNLLEWKAYYGIFRSAFRLAYLDESYRYFENRNRDEYVSGRAKTGIAKYDLSYTLGDGINISGILDYEYTIGEGTNINEHERNTGSVGLLFSHDLEKLEYELSARKEVSDRYNSPLLFSVSAGYSVTDFYRLKGNLSKNYRTPTFNDLFWESGGNTDLVPEESLQAEIVQAIAFGRFGLSVTAYVMEISNLLRWVPSSTGAWKPENTEEVRNYGMEVISEWQRTYGNHNFSFNATYAYTRTRDKKLEKELIYVPRHKATASAAYSLKRFSSYYQHLYNGSIYTSSDNFYELDSYNISNAGLNYKFGNKKQFICGLEIRNIWNKRYQSLPSRPMPGRSINSSLTVKF